MIIGLRTMQKKNMPEKATTSNLGGTNLLLMMPIASRRTENQYR
jgi:hypothetical protein